MKLELEIADKNPETYGKEYNQNSLGWKYLKEFISWCDKRKVKVIFIPSTLMDIAKSKGLNYIGEPFDYMYNKSLYFNTNFHLNNIGRKIRTEQIIKDLVGVEDTFKHLNNRIK